MWKVYSKPCHRCGRSNHDPRECRFCEAECHFCKKKGHLALVAEPSSHRSLRVKTARQVVARITAQGLRQPNGLMRLSQKRGKIICSCMSLGSNLHTCTTLTCGSMASNCAWNRHRCLFLDHLRDSEEGVVSPCHGAKVHGASFKYIYEGAHPYPGTAECERALWSATGRPSLNRGWWRWPLPLGTELAESHLFGLA